MQEPRPLRTGDPQRIGAYRLIGLLGEGGQGAVYRGEAANGDHVAVKLLHARFSGDARARARFAAELAHAERVAPFCTARVLDADLEGDRPYIVSEFVDGPSLSEVIAAGNIAHGPALHRLAIATVTALAAIHEAGIVHRDFKPGNVIMGPDGARVIDFGIARALEATGTLSSAIVGTPAYMAPEQISGGRIGPATDIFAWGCTIAYASNGVTPFGQDSIPAVMHRILHEQPDLGELTGPLRDIAGACLAKDPAHRPTARQILLRLLGGTESATAPEALLTEGTRASASPPAGAFSPGHMPPVREPHTPAPNAPGPQMPGPYPAPALRPDGPWQQHRPAPPHSPSSRTRSRKPGRAAARTTAAAALVLGVTTFLPWARVGVDIGVHRLTDVADVSGMHTIWGILTLITAVVAINIAITHEFTQRFAVVWAAVPGCLAIASVAGLLLRRQDLHEQHPHYGKLTSDELRAMGMALHISLSPGVYIALAAAVAITASALVSLASRRP
jgi:serine/threonine protein kinase